VIFESDRIDIETLRQTIRGLGYDPVVLGGIPTPASAASRADFISTQKLPTDLQAILAAARSADVPLLFDFAAPG